MNKLRRKLMFNKDKVHNKFLKFVIITGLLLLGAALVTGCGKKAVTVTFDSNGGMFKAADAKAAKFTAVGTDNKMVTVVVKPDAKGKTPADSIITAPSGKKFKEWNNVKTPTKDAPGKTKGAAAEFSPWTDFGVKDTETKLTLYAIWEDAKAAAKPATTMKKDVTVTFDANGGTFDETKAVTAGFTKGTDNKMVTVMVKADKTGKTPATDILTAPTGKTFKEWNTLKMPATGTPGKVKGAAADFSPWTDFDVKEADTTLTLYAIWK